MNFGDREVEIVIVGANPSGLLLAAQLLNLGLQPIIIDSQSSSPKASPAISLQSRTLEVFGQLGLAEELVSQGLKCEGLTVQMGKDVIGYVNYAHLATLTQFPFILNIHQKKIEEVLIKYLTMRACAIYWNAELISLEQDDKKVAVKIKREGELINCTGKWIVVADEGQFSHIEKNSYNLWQTSKSYYQLDSQTEERHNRKMHLFLSKQGFALASPIDTQGRYDFLGSFPRKAIVSNQYSEVKKALDTSLGFQLPVESCNWTKVTGLQGRLAAQYIKQRTILIGNAAFSQTAFLGNEINNGIQGAHNLGWKIANVCLGKQDESILYSYEEERRELDARHFKRNYWLSKLLLISNVLPSEVFKKLVRSLLKNTALFLLNHNYRSSRLALHHSLGGKIKAGDRIPYLTIYDEKKKEETDLHQWCKKQGFVLLLLGNLSSHSLFIMAQWMKHKYTQHMHLFYLPYSLKNDLIFEAFDIQSDRNKMILIRPDMHIAYMHDIVSANLIDTYMTEVMKWKL